MAQVFEGRFYSLTGDGNYLANLSDYALVEYDAPDEDGGGGLLVDAPPLEAGRGESYSYVVDPVGQYDRVVRLGAIKDQPGRGELRPVLYLFPDVPGPVYGEAWITFNTLMMPGDFDLYEPVTGTSAASDVLKNWANNKCVFFQSIQGIEQPDAQRGPQLSLYTEQKHIGVQFMYDTTDPSTEVGPNFSVIDRSIPLTFGRWLKWGIHQKYAYNTDGFIYIYLDDRLIYSQTSTPNTLNNVLGPYFKIGVYKYSSTSANIVYDLVASRVGVYTTGCTIWDSSSTYADVFGHADYGRPAGRGMI